MFLADENTLETHNDVAIVNMETPVTHIHPMTLDVPSAINIFYMKCIQNTFICLSILGFQVVTSYWLDFIHVCCRNTMFKGPTISVMKT